MLIFRKFWKNFEFQNRVKAKIEFGIYLFWETSNPHSPSFAREQSVFDPSGAHLAAHLLFGRRVYLQVKLCQR